MLLETAEIVVTSPAEQMTPALGHDEALMQHGASAARGDELDAEQSVPLPAGGSVSRVLEGRDVPGDTKGNETLMKMVKATIESGDKNLLFVVDVDGLTLLHAAANRGLVDS